MKKENITGLIVYLIILGLAVVFGLVVLREYFTYAGGNAMEGWQFILCILGAVVSGAIINGVVFELAHMLGAKIGGYRILSVSIFGLTWYKVDKKTKFRFGSYDGLTGETKIAPINGRKKEPNPTAYLLLGSLFFAIEIFISVFAFIWILSFNKDTPLLPWGYFILTGGVVGAMILVYNILPLHLDSMTDGYRLRQVSGLKNRKAFNNLLRVENGESPVEGDAAEVDNKPTQFSADLQVNELYGLLNERDYLGAEKILDETILCNNKISKNAMEKARAQKIFIVLMSRTLEEATEFYEKEISINFYICCLYNTYFWIRRAFLLWRKLCICTYGIYNYR